MRSPFGVLNTLLYGLRFRLLLLVAVACAPLVALTVHTASEDRRRAQAGWRQKSQRLAQLAVREEDRLVGTTRQLLLAIAQSAPVRTTNPHASQKLMEHLFAAYPRYANLGVILTDGTVLAAAQPLAQPDLQTNQSYFTRVLAKRGFAIGTPSSPTTKAGPRVEFGYPVIDKEKRLQAVVFATLLLDALNRFGSEVPGQLPTGANWMQVDRKGAVLRHYPAPSTNPPPQVPPLPETAWQEQRGTSETKDGRGAVIYHAFTPLKSPLTSDTAVAILSIRKGTLFAEADRALGRNLAWLGLAAGLAIVLGWLGSDFLILRPIRALVHSSTRLAAGDLTVRTHLQHGQDELGQLTLAFDGMAEALQQRETERQRASHKLQALSRRLVEVQESERRAIARELHDEIGQSLTVAEMNLQAARQAPEAGPLEARLKVSAEMVERVLQQVHDLSLNLRPSMLDDLGLEPAMRWYTHRQASLAGLAAEFDAEPLDQRLDPMIETECFRVAQEALTNIVRHAQARAVSVQLSQHDGHLHLSVRDDGIGFEVPAMRDQAVRGASLGLLSMEERAALAGGGLELLSAPGRGTEVRAWFPLRWKKPHP